MKKSVMAVLLYTASISSLLMGDPSIMHQKAIESENGIHLVTKRYYIKSSDKDDEGIITKRYAIVNGSDKDAEILNVNPHCSCTGYDLTKEVLAPGDTSYLELSVSFDQLKALRKTYATIKLSAMPKYMMVEMRVDESEED